MAVLALAVLVGLAGWLFAWRRAVVLAVLAALWLAVMLVMSFAPASALATFIGGTVRHWAVWGGVLAVIAGYALLVGYLRRRAVPLAPAQVSDGAPFSDAELDRYARHIVLREIGGPGQKRLKDAKVLVVGAGGLGSPVLFYLAAAGVGQITIADDDTVGLSNLQRQIIHRTEDSGQPKSVSAIRAMAALNPHIRALAAPALTDQNAAGIVAGQDLVLDGTDSFATRALINAACVGAGVPLIAGAIGQWEGQVSLYDPARGGPCLCCIFPDAPAPGLVPACAEAGVVGALPGVVGSVMALEAIKHLTGAGQGLRGRMLIYDGLYGETRMMTLRANPDCPVCDGRGA